MVSHWTYMQVSMGSNPWRGIYFDYFLAINDTMRKICNGIFSEFKSGTEYLVQSQNWHVFLQNIRSLIVIKINFLERLSQKKAVSSLSFEHAVKTWQLFHIQYINHIASIIFAFGQEGSYENSENDTSVLDRKYFDLPFLKTEFSDL